MYKTVGCIVIIISCLFFGFLKIMELKRRFHYLKEFRMMFEKVRTEISLKMTPLPRTIKKVGNDFSNICFIKCADYISELGGQAAFEKAFNESKKMYSLKSEDIAVVRIFASGIGKCDIHNQLRQMDYSLKMLDESVNEAKEDFKTKQTVYISCSVLAGAFLVLVLL